MTDIERGLQAALDADPSNSLIRLVLADHLEEIGDDRAEGYRVLGELWKVPARFGKDGTGWYADRLRRGTPPVTYLADCWFDQLPTRKVGWWWAGSTQLYDTRRETEDLAALAFATLPADVQTEIRGKQAEVLR